MKLRFEVMKKQMGTIARAQANLQARLLRTPEDRTAGHHSERKTDRSVGVPVTMETTHEASIASRPTIQGRALFPMSASRRVCSKNPGRNKGRNLMILAAETSGVRRSEKKLFWEYAKAA
jgi:hypothetical protein